MASRRRDKLVETALQLFCQNGFHATGIDTILAEAGVAKMTLYNHFKSKDELIVAALQLRQEQFFLWLNEESEKRHAPGQKRAQTERLSTLFDILHDWVIRARLNGCIFTNAAAEFSDDDSPIRKQVKHYKQARIDYIDNLLREDGIENTEVLSQQINMLWDGAVVAVQAGLGEGSIKSAKSAALSLVRAGNS